MESVITDLEHLNLIDILLPAIFKTLENVNKLHKIRANIIIFFLFHVFDRY